MNRILRYIFILILIVSLYHLVRDILQTLEFKNLLTTFLYRPHIWCKPYCNYVTYPLDILGIFGSFIVLKRNKLGVLGAIVILSQTLWFLAALLP